MLDAVEADGEGMLDVLAGRVGVVGAQNFDEPPVASGGVFADDETEDGRAFGAVALQSDFEGHDLRSMWESRPRAGKTA